jgi:hypothetical protein
MTHYNLVDFGGAMKLDTLCSFEMWYNTYIALMISIWMFINVQSSKYTLRDCVYAIQLQPSNHNEGLLSTLNVKLVTKQV